MLRATCSQLIGKLKLVISITSTASRGAHPSSDSWEVAPDCTQEAMKAWVSAKQWQQDVWHDTIPYKAASNACEKPRQCRRLRAL